MSANFKRKENQEQAQDDSIRDGVRGAITMFSGIKESMLQ